MKGELLGILDHMEREKGIEREVLIQALESALLSAAKKTIKGKEGELSVKFDAETGDIKVFSGDTLIKSEEFGRIAAQTAKQVIIQKIREAERNVIFEEFKDKVGEIVSGTIYRFEKGGLIINIGKAEGIILRKFQVPKENYGQGQRIRAYVEEVEQSSRGPRIILSRTNPEFVKKLFELEVPEIYEHIVEIKKIAREPGERTKVAVLSHDDRVDSQGACVGVRGSRVKNVVGELEGEKVDIVKYSTDLKEFIKNALSPAEIMEIQVNEKDGGALVLVNDDQLSLAIGKHGQNVRLASKLVGFNLNIKSASEVSKASKTEKKSKKPEKSGVSQLEGVGKKTAEALLEAGYDTLDKIAEVSLSDLVKVPGIGVKTAEKIITKAKEVS
ncbi:MAG: transcription termination factor NusA [Candidatus Kappaea frigidicola]|nr:transcription termination factor NusA [Candidatus Kappaea frigidicola]